jgi:hypothetical protein
VALITGPFRPDFYRIPALPKFGVVLRPVRSHAFERSYFDEFFQIVGVAGIDLPLVRKLVPACLLRDASLYCTLDRVAGEIVCTIGMAGLEKCTRLFQSDSRQLLKLLPIHAAL